MDCHAAVAYTLWKCRTGNSHTRVVAPSVADSSRHNASPSTLPVSQKIDQISQVGFQQEFFRNSPDLFGEFYPENSMSPYPSTFAASLASSSNLNVSTDATNITSRSSTTTALPIPIPLHVTLASPTTAQQSLNYRSDYDDNELEGQLEYDDIDAYRMFRTAFQDELLFLEDDPQPLAASEAITRAAPTFSEKEPQRLAEEKKEKEEAAHKKMVENSRAEAEGEGLRLHEEWVSKHLDRFKISRRVRTLALIAEAERKLKPRLDKEEELKKKWSLITDYVRRQLPKESKELGELCDNHCTDDIINGLSWSRIWNFDTTTLEISNASQQNQCTILGAIKTAEAARLHHERRWIDKRNIFYNEHTEATLRAEFRRTYPCILFATQLPLEQQITLGVPQGPF